MKPTPENTEQPSVSSEESETSARQTDSQRRRLFGRALRSHDFWGTVYERISILIKKRGKGNRPLHQDNTELQEDFKVHSIRQSFWRVISSRRHPETFGANFGTLSRGNSVWSQNVALIDTQYVLNSGDNSELQAALVTTQSSTSSFVNEFNGLEAIYTSDDADPLFAICVLPETTVSTSVNSRAQSPQVPESALPRKNTGESTEPASNNYTTNERIYQGHEDQKVGCDEDFRGFEIEHHPIDKKRIKKTKTKSSMIPDITKMFFKAMCETVPSEACRGQPSSSEFDSLHSPGNINAIPHSFVRSEYSDSLTPIERSNTDYDVLLPYGLQATNLSTGNRKFHHISFPKFNGFFQMSQYLRLSGDCGRGSISHFISQMRDYADGSGKLQGTTTKETVSSFVKRIPFVRPELSSINFGTFGCKRSSVCEASQNNSVGKSNGDVAENTDRHDLKPKTRIRSPSPTQEERTSRIQKLLPANRKRQRINPDSLWTALSLNNEPQCQRFRKEYISGESYTIFREVRLLFDSATLKVLTLDWANNQPSHLTDCIPTARKIKFSEKSEFVELNSIPIGINFLNIGNSVESILKAPSPSVARTRVPTKDFQQNLNQIEREREEKEMWRKLSYCRHKLNDLNSEPTLERRKVLIDSLRESVHFTKTHFVRVAKTQILDYIGYLIEIRKHLMLVYDRMVDVGDQYASILYRISREFMNLKYLEEIESELLKLTSAIKTIRLISKETEVEISRMKAGFHEYVKPMVSRAQQAVSSRMEHSEVYLDFCGAEYVGSSIEHEPHDHTLYDGLMSESDFLIDGLENFSVGTFSNALSDLSRCQQNIHIVENDLKFSIEKILSGIIHIRLQWGEITVPTPDSDVDDDHVLGFLAPDEFTEEFRDSDNSLDTTSIESYNAFGRGSDNETITSEELFFAPIPNST